MSNRRRVRRITIEQHEVKITRRGGERVTAYCEHCGSVVTALIPEAAGMTPNEARDVHFIETAGAERLLCDGSQNNSE